MDTVIYCTDEKTNHALNIIRNDGYSNLHFIFPLLFPWINDPLHHAVTIVINPLRTIRRDGKIKRKKIRNNIPHFLFFF